MDETNRRRRGFGADTPLRRNRDFRLLWTGQVVSVLGSQISWLAYPLLVLAMTGSAIRAGLVGAVGTAPYLLAQIPAGILVDRGDRRKIMLACDAGRLLALGSIPLAAALWHVSYPQILVVAFIEGTLFVGFNLAERAGVPVVVGPDEVLAALAQNQARSQAARLAGPALSGVLFALWRFLPFLVDAVSYLASLIAVAMMRTNLTAPRPEPEPEGAAAPAPEKSIRRELREGASWLWHQPFLRAGAMLIAAVNPVLTAVSLAVIVLARHYGAAPFEIGLVVGCSGVGGLLGAMAAPRLLRPAGPRVIIVGGTWIWAAILVFMASTGRPLELAPSAAALAFLGPAWNVTLQATRASLVPNHLLGRVSSVTLMVSWCTLPFGSLLGGIMLQHAGPVATMWVLAGLMGVVAVIASLSPSLRADTPPAPSRPPSRGTQTPRPV